MKGNINNFRKNQDNIHLNMIFNICNEFLQVPSSIGFEKPFLDYLNKRAKKLGYETILKNDYLVVKPKNEIKTKINDIFNKLNKNSNKSKYLFSVHIDRHSLILNDDNQIEYLANYWKKKLSLPFRKDIIRNDEKELFNYLGLNCKKYNIDFNDKELIFKINENFALKYLRQGGEYFYETIGLRHTNESISSYDVKTGKILNRFKTLRFDVDFGNNLVTFDVNKKLSSKDKVFMLNSKIQKLGNYFSGQLDNVISAAVLFYLLETTDFKEEIILTTKEEIGKSYECVLDYMQNNLHNLKLIVLDTSPYLNFKEKKDGFLVLRKGDENGLFDEKLVLEIQKLIELEKIPYLYKPAFTGITELGRVVSSTKGKINGVTVQIPTMNYHTTYESSTFKCLENYVKVIKDLIEVKK